jgi:hypothetical protein
MATDLNIEALIARQRVHMAEQARIALDRASDLIARFTELAAKKGVVLGSDAFKYVQTIGIVASAPGLAKTLLGAMHIERDGLFLYDEIACKLPPGEFHVGCFIGSEYIIMAHPCYRRQMHPDANWAPRFVEKFWAFEKPGVKKYIAIDEDRVRINVDDSAYFEEDTWYGPPFDEDIKKIKSGLVKLRPPLDLKPEYVRFFFSDAYSLDIKWSEGNGIKTFQAIELKTDDVKVDIAGNVYHPARYLHAEFDLDMNCFRHFDGAIQYFTKEEYLLRRDSDFNMTSKNSEHIKAQSQKVFKLNGPIATEVFVDFCSHFFTANPLVFEYFTGSYPESINEILKKICNIGPNPSDV